MYARSDDASQLSGPNMLLSTSVGNFYAYACLHTSTMNRRKVGGICVSSSAATTTATWGSMTDDLTILDVVWQFTPTAGASFDLYFSDAIKDFYAKPPVSHGLVLADNLKEGYTNGFPTCRPAICRAATCRPRTIWPRLGVDQLTVANLLEMQAAGWDIVPHQTIGTALTSNRSGDAAEVEGPLPTGHRADRIYHTSIVLSPGGNHNATSDAVLRSLPSNSGIIRSLWDIPPTKSMAGSSIRCTGGPQPEGQTF